MAWTCNHQKIVDIHCNAVIISSERQHSKGAQVSDWSVATWKEKLKLLLVTGPSCVTH